VVCPHYIDTGMFEGVKTSFLLPLLNPDRVARAIVRAVQRNRSRLILPRWVGLVPMLRVVPPRLFDRAADWLGVNTAMDSYAGHAPPTASVPPPDHHGRQR
jgi:all-trans-retinol dehydrogenase (NAD+)